MATMIHTKNRLSSAKSTHKVIKAMELVASSKIKRARVKANNVKFFYDTTIDAMSNLYSHGEVKKFLNKPNASDKTLYFIITSDMGLCGAYNMNVIKKLFSDIETVTDYDVINLGLKGQTKLNYEGIPMVHNIVNYGSKDEYQLSREISDVILKKYHNNEINSVKIIYTKFVNALVQEVEMIDLFKLDEISFNKETPKANLLFEPSEEEVFSQLLDQYIVSIVYSTLLQSLASEHSYRRNSMESANKNSDELIGKLNLELNRIRQAMITQEISEIIGGSEALDKG